MSATTNQESAVKARYAAGAQAQEPALCCPVSYDPGFLEAIPQEVIDRDYGCGDPSKAVRPGETVLDLGSGTGKICFIASQVVGAAGKVIGVDMTDEMLEVARRNAPLVAENLGFANVEFRKGRIQDLALDLERLDSHLAEHPANGAESYLESEAAIARLRAEHPLVADASVDVVVSNCVLNLVSAGHREQLFAEIARVLRPGGRAVISDIVSDETVPDELRDDPELWSGCISGAFQEHEFLEAFTSAGFEGVHVTAFGDEPWRTVAGIEFRTMTVCAYKPSDDPCRERRQAVIYRGPFQAVTDDNGHTMERGRRYAVCDRTFRAFQNAPFADQFLFVEPAVPVPAESAELYDCTVTRLRDPSETKANGSGSTAKNQAMAPATDAGACCPGDGSGTPCC